MKHGTITKTMRAIILFITLTLHERKTNALCQELGGARTCQQKLVRDLLDGYDNRVKPTKSPFTPVTVQFRLDLYQIIEVDEPQQQVKLSAWISENWEDELLYWDPGFYGNITSVNLPHNVVWKPDTTLYNTLVMRDEDVRRLVNIQLTSNSTLRSARVAMLYPIIFTFSCQMHLLHFPFDTQKCALIFGSWTYDSSGIDYFPTAKHVGMNSYLANEGWNVISFTATRRQINYSCCPYPWTNLFYELTLKRKPLFYIVNLIVPTCIITLISIVGFFMPSTAGGERHEKISLGITTLLSMSILLLMVSHEMPTTSSFIPLIGWFYLSMIVVISAGTIMSSVVISVQKRGNYDERLSESLVNCLVLLSTIFLVRVPEHISRTTSCNVEDSRWRVGKHKQKAAVMTANSPSSELLMKENSTKSAVDQNGDHLLRNNNVAGECGALTATTAFSSGSRQRSTALANREHRVFAAREWDWLATLIERVSFIFFFSILLVITLAVVIKGAVHTNKSTVIG